MKDPKEDCTEEDDDQVKEVIVPGNNRDKLRKALYEHITLFGSKSFTGEDLKAHAYADALELDFTDEQIDVIIEEHVKRAHNVEVGRLKALGTRAVEAHVSGLSFQKERQPTKESVRFALLTIAKDEYKRLLYANTTDIRDTVEYLNARKALSDHHMQKAIKSYEDFLQQMKDDGAEYAGDLFPDV